MSRENVEAVQKGFVVWGETGEPDWSKTHAQIEIHDHDIMDASQYRGHEGFRSWLEDWSSAWSNFSMEPEEFIDAGERVVVVLRMRATGRGSGAEVERQDAIVFEIRDGLTVRIDYYNNRAQALKAVGLSE
jgi:ketosteroid isomerase-like protein